MPAIVRVGDMCSGHDHWPPRPAAAGSPNVFVNGQAVVRVGDSWEPHTCVFGHKHETPATTHAGTQAAGSSKVFANGKPLARIGDAIDCGSAAAAGSSNVFCA